MALAFIVRFQLEEVCCFNQLFLCQPAQKGKPDKRNEMFVAVKYLIYSPQVTDQKPKCYFLLD